MYEKINDDQPMGMQGSRATMKWQSRFWTVAMQSLGLWTPYMEYAMCGVRCFSYDQFNLYFIFLLHAGLAAEVANTAWQTRDLSV